MSRILAGALGGLAVAGIALGLWALMRAELLLHSPIEFPVLLTTVIYDGTHAGDWLDLSDVDRLSREIGHLRSIQNQGMGGAGGSGV